MKEAKEAARAISRAAGKALAGMTGVEVCEFSYIDFGDFNRTFPTFITAGVAHGSRPNGKPPRRDPGESRADYMLRFKGWKAKQDEMDTAKLKEVIAKLDAAGIKWKPFPNERARVLLAQY